MGSNQPRLAVLLGALAALVASAMCLASAARAAERVYWANFNAPISFANLDGSGGGGDLDTTGATVDGPEGVAIDSAAGRIYWVNAISNSISFANLSGGGGGNLDTTGATIDQPYSAAIDPSGGRIYWANYSGGSGGTISFANLNGSGGGDLNTSGATVIGPSGVAIDPPAGKIYWGNYDGNSVSFANLDGSGGGGDLNTAGATMGGPNGVAIDPAAGRIYWVNYDTNSISFANLSGGGGGDLNTSGAALNFLYGAAIDPAAGKIYWTSAGDNSISFANLDGSGGGTLSTSGATVSAPEFLALLRAPSDAGAPVVTGGSVPGSMLSCSQGSWAPDLLGSFLYRAPQSFAYQWIMNGTSLAGATSSLYTPSSNGEYRCAVTARNHAGSTSRSSDPHTVRSNRFSFAKLRRNTHRGTATLAVEVPGPGRLSLTGGGVVKQRPARGAQAVAAKTIGAAGKVRMLIKAKRKAKRKLNHRGKVSVRVRVTYTPSGGSPNTQTKGVKLRKKISRP